MSIELFAIRRIRAVVETTYAVDQTSGGYGSFVDIPAQEGVTLARSIVSLDPQTVVQHRVAHRTHVLGRRDASLPITQPLAATGVAADSATSTVEPPWVLLSRVVLGGRRSGHQGSSVAAATSGSVFDVTSGHGTRFAAGTAIGIVQSGRLHVREIRDVTGNTITLRKALPATPTVGATVFNSVSVWPVENPSESLQVLVQGAETDDACLLLGCHGSSLELAIDPSAGAIPTIGITLTAASWLSRSEIATPPSALAAATFSNFAPIAATIGDVREGESTPTNTATVSVLASQIQISPQISAMHVTGLAGPQGRHSWRAGRGGVFATGTITIPFEDETWDTYNRTLSLRYLSIQIGATAGGTVILVFPRVQVTGVTPADAAGISGIQIAWQALHDTLADDERGRAPMRIHVV